MTHLADCADCRFFSDYVNDCTLSNIRILNGNCTTYEKPANYDIKEFMREMVGGVQKEIRELAERNNLK